MRHESLLRNQTALIELAQSRARGPDRLRAILAAAAATLPVGRAGFWTLADEGRRLVCKQQLEVATGTFGPGEPLDAADYPAYFAALHAYEVVVAHDAATDPRTIEFHASYLVPHHITAMLDVPVWGDGGLVGVLCLEHLETPRVWSAEDEQLGRSLASMVSLALEEEARGRAEERWRVLSRASGEVVWVWDIAQGTIDWSEALATTFLHDVPSGVTSLDWWLDHVHPADRDRAHAEALQSTTRGAFDLEYRFRRGDGTYAIVADRGWLTRDESGTAMRVTGAMQDVTERRTLEQRLLLADRMASLGTLAAGVAHEINNPLAYVKGNLELALEELREAPGVSAEVIASLEDALTGAERVRNIVIDLKTLSRPDAETTCPVDVQVVVESSIGMAWNHIRHRATLVADIAPVPPVLAAEARLGQVVLNLLVNAAQALPESTTDRNEILVSTSVDAEGRVVIEVSDNGPGIPDDVLPRIFDPFFTTKQVGQGTGLGLPISHSIVRALGGTIAVEARPTGGVTFRVTLPAAQQAAVVAPPPPPPVEARRGRVLVIDDDPFVASVVRRSLARAHDVDVASGGRLALEMLQGEHVYEAIVCDVMMPEVSGMDIHAELARSAPHLRARMIFLTGGTFTPRAQDFLAATDRPALTKPFDADELRRVVAATVAGIHPAVTPAGTDDTGPGER